MVTWAWRLKELVACCDPRYQEELNMKQELYTMEVQVWRRRGERRGM